MAAFVEETDASLRALVFFMITWQRGDLGPTVVALWMESLRAMVPPTVRLIVRKLSVPENVPGLPKTVPMERIPNQADVKNACSQPLICSRPARSVRRLLHSSSSLGEQALKISSKS